MKVRVLRCALEVWQRDANFTTSSRRASANIFFDSLFSEIDSLVLYGGVHRLQFGFHRLLAKHFPYAIYYRVIGDEAVVFRVLDCRRDSRWIRSTLHKASLANASA